MKNQRIRRIIQAASLVLLTGIGILHQIVGGGVKGTPSVDSLCAFGGLETLFSALQTGQFIKGVEQSSVILLLLVGVITVVFGKVFCGVFCPLGALQDLFNNLGKLLKINPRRLPQRLHNVLRYLKYVVLGLVLILSWRAASLIIKPYDPWAAYMHIAGGTSAWVENIWGLVLLGALLAAGMFVERFWCQYLCPLGAFLTLLARFGLYKVETTSDCVSCGLCNKSCPVSLNLPRDKSASPECTVCGQCAAACPKSNALGMKTQLMPRKLVGMTTVFIVTALLFVGSIGLTKATGLFQTAQPIEKVLTNDSNEKDPANIKGYMTIDDISKEFNLPVDLLRSKLALPENIPSNMALKDIKTQMEKLGKTFDPEDARDVVEDILAKTR